RARILRIRVPAGNLRVGARTVPVVDDRQAVGVLVAGEVGADAGEAAVGRHVADATQVAQRGVVHLAQVVVGLERGHAGVDLAEAVQIVDHAAVPDGAAAAVRRNRAAGAGAD